MFLLICEITPHPSEKENTKPRLTNFKLTLEAVQCCFYRIVETGKCDKLKIPTVHALECCVCRPVSPLASLVEPPQACERGQSCFYKEIMCKSVYKKIQVLKSQGVKCRCTYGVILPGEYLQVARWWQRRCLGIRCSTTWSSLRASTPTPTCVTYQLCRGGFTIPKKETMKV